MTIELAMKGEGQKPEHASKFDFVGRSCHAYLPTLVIHPEYSNIGKRQRRVGKGKVLNSLKKPTQKSEDCILL